MFLLYLTFIDIVIALLHKNKSLYVPTADKFIVVMVNTVSLLTYTFNENP